MYQKLSGASASEGFFIAHFFYGILIANGIQRIRDSGEATPTYRYDAFGNQKPRGFVTVTDLEETDPNPFRYCGEYFDSETGEVYLRARYYDTATGRFGREDPAKDGNGWYNYCDGNPIGQIDPSGLSAKALPSKDKWNKNLPSTNKGASENTVKGLSSQPAPKNEEPEYSVALGNIFQKNAFSTGQQKFGHSSLIRTTGTPIYGMLMLLLAILAIVAVLLPIIYGTPISVPKVTEAPNTVERPRYLDIADAICELISGDAVDQLLDGATHRRTTKGNTEIYDKEGGYEQALEDFENLPFTHVDDYGDRQVGYLPDGTKVILRPSTEGPPTIEIQNPEGKSQIEIRYH